jgi:hypothetical protein
VIVENENDVVEFLLYLHGMFQLVGGTDSYRSVEYASILPSVRTLPEPV